MRFADLRFACFCEFATNAGDLSEFEFCMLAGSGIRGIVKDELETYLGCNPPPAGQNILEFWKSQESILSELSSVAKKVLGTLANPLLDFAFFLFSLVLLSF